MPQLSQLLVVGQRVLHPVYRKDVRDSANGEDMLRADKSLVTEHYRPLQAIPEQLGGGRREDPELGALPQGELQLGQDGEPGARRARGIGSGRARPQKSQPAAAARWAIGQVSGPIRSHPGTKFRR